MTVISAKKNSFNFFWLGNAFTTLEGVEFNWKISSQHPVEGKERDWQRVLRFLRFSESKYHDVPSTVEKFDRVGLKGYMVLLEGINTGSAKVSVALPYPEYQGTVPSLEVNIVVLANIILHPSDVHILVGDSISFQILQVNEHITMEFLKYGNTKLEIGIYSRKQSNFFEFAYFS